MKMVMHDDQENGEYDFDKWAMEEWRDWCLCMTQYTKYIKPAGQRAQPALQGYEVHKMKLICDCHIVETV